MRRLLWMLLVLLVSAPAGAWAIVWFPGYRIPVGWEYTRDQYNGLIEEEVGGDYILDEQDNGPHDPLIQPRLPRS